jgi:catechol 2,3-dioxygenase-like lactoylglutathione lyase family enzyme
MPAIVQGILETALYVTDPERSAAFYETVMGFTAFSPKIG